MTLELLDAADYYIALGLRVIALTGKMPNGKVHPHGLHDHLYEGRAGLKVRHAAFTHPATTGIGILTGPEAYVVDIDGEDGAIQWRSLVGDEADFTWTAKTGRGLHLYYRHPAVAPFRTVKLGPKLDFKGEGGYVAAPPSLHPDGHRYEWLVAPDEGYILEMPQKLLTILRDVELEREGAAANRKLYKLTAKHPFVDGKLYAVATFGGILDHVRNATEGNRNNILYWAAATMLEEGADDEDLQELYEVATGIGLTRFETKQSIRSAMRNLNE